MICPYCYHAETKVIDKRDTEGISATKRRRECLKCGKRFNTFEAVEAPDLRVVKKDSSRENFDREKLKRGVLKACEKRAISSETIEKMVSKVEEKLRRRGKEVRSALIGEIVSRELKKVDKVAYIRFASVYRDFRDLSDFRKELKELAK